MTTRQDEAEEERSLMLECGLVVADYELDRQDVRRAIFAAKERAAARNPGRRVRPDVRYLLDLLGELEAASRRRAH